MVVTPQEVKKYSLYKGENENYDIKYLNLDDIEIAFCHYCSAVGKMVPSVYTADLSNPNSEEYARIANMVDLACKILDCYAEKYLPDPKADVKCLDFTKDQFLQDAVNLKWTCANLVADHMAGVVYNQTVEKGYKLYNEYGLRPSSVKGDVVNLNSFHNPQDTINYKIRKSEAYR